MPSGRGRRRTLSVVPDFGEHPGAELNAEAREAEDDLSVRVLGESLFDRLGQVVGGGAGGFKLDQKSEHLLAQRVFDQLGLMGPVRAEDLAEPFGPGFDASFAAGPLERGLELSAVSRAALAGVGAALRSSWASGQHKLFFHDSKAASAAG
jgi:hypothetical protein